MKKSLLLIALVILASGCVGAVESQTLDESQETSSESTDWRTAELKDVRRARRSQ